MKPINFMNVGDGIRPYEAKKFAKFGFFVFWVRNLQMWPDQRDSLSPTKFDYNWSNVSPLRAKNPKLPRVIATPAFFPVIIRVN